jgi:hypothetical protein
VSVAAGNVSRLLLIGDGHSSLDSFVADYPFPRIASRLEVEYAVKLSQPSLEITPAAVNCGGLPQACLRGVPISVKNVGSAPGKFWVRYRMVGDLPLAQVVVVHKDMHGQWQPFQAMQEGPGNTALSLPSGSSKALEVRVLSLPDAVVGTPFTFEMQVRTSLPFPFALSSEFVVLSAKPACGALTTSLSHC